MLREDGKGNGVGEAASRAEKLVSGELTPKRKLIRLAEAAIQLRLQGENPTSLKIAALQTAAREVVKQDNISAKDIAQAYVSVVNFCASSSTKWNTDESIKANLLGIGFDADFPQDRTELFIAQAISVDPDAISWIAGFQSRYALRLPLYRSWDTKFSLVSHARKITNETEAKVALSKVNHFLQQIALDFLVLGYISPRDTISKTMDVVFLLELMRKINVYTPSSIINAQRVDVLDLAKLALAKSNGEIKPEDLKTTPQADAILALYYALRQSNMPADHPDIRKVFALTKVFDIETILQFWSFEDPEFGEAFSRWQKDQKAIAEFIAS